MKLGFLRKDDGAAAVEFGLIAPIIAAVLVGVTTTGGAILAYSKMRQAVSSGAQYALAVEDDLDAVEDVVEASWPSRPAGATVSVTRVCYCPSSDTTTVSCSTNCADTSYPKMYTRINASRPYTAFRREAITLNASQKVRTR